MLDNWQRYSELGINIALGSDTYPRDMILNMRTASYHGKVMSHNYKAATAADVFTAATLGGARSLGRDDLGRLVPGARADIAATYAADVFSDVLNQPGSRFQRKLVEKQDVRGGDELAR